MITPQHRNLLNSLIDAGDSQGIHTLMEQLSVADQKQLKLALAQTLGNKNKVDTLQVMKIFTDLVPLNLNLYYKSFLMAAENLKQEENFWKHLSILKPLGEFLGSNKAYYRQNLLTTWLNGLKPGHSSEELFQVMQVTNPVIQLNYLIESDSLYGFYQFMTLAISKDVDSITLSKLIRKLLLPNEKFRIPQNMREDTANFLSHYFNINDIHYPFHRTLDTTMFSYAEKSYESFLRVIVPASRIKDFLGNL